MALFAPTKRDVVTAHIFPGDGGRLVDKECVEDREVNALISYSHKMAFPLRRPVRVYRHMRNGLQPMKVSSLHMITQPPKDPGMDLEFLIQLEGGWRAAYAGEITPEDEDTRRMVWLRYLAMGGAIAAFLTSLILRQVGADDGGATEEAAKVLINGISS